MKSRGLSFALLIALAGAAGACAGTASEDDAVGTEAESIEQVAPAEQYPEAVLLDVAKDGTPGPGCSGVLVAPRAVLTSGWCAATFDRWTVRAPFAFGQTARGVRAAVYDFGGAEHGVDGTVDKWHGARQSDDARGGVDGTVDSWHGGARQGNDARGGVDGNVDQWRGHDEGAGRPAGEARGDEHDVGIVFLDTPIELRAYPDLATLPVGAADRVVPVGRALDGNASRTTTYAGPPVTLADASRYGFPYDYAARGVVDQGDSGGPAFRDGTHTVVGVGAGSLSSTALLARVDLVNAWITEQVATAEAR